MRRKWKSIVGLTLCVSLGMGQLLPVTVAAQEKQVQESQQQITVTTPQEPSEWKLGDITKSKTPVGGVGRVELAEFPVEETAEVEVLAEEIDSTYEPQEAVNGSLNCDYGYNTLSATEKKVYKLLLSAMQSFDQSSKSAQRQYSYSGFFYVAGKVDVKSYQLSQNQMKRVYFALEADYLEFYWLDDSIGYTTSNGFVVNEWYIMVEPDYADYSTRKAAKNNIKRGMIPFLEKIDNAKASGASQLELELLIHDMIIEEVDYAYDAWGNPQTASYAHTIVGVFDDNSATDVVCEGYAKAFQLLCRYAGLESIYAVGWSTTSSGSGGHAWNLVKINGSWYNVDTTWDDSNGSNYGGYMYDFFNLPTSVFNQGKAHDYRPDIFAGMYTVPNATATAAGYYNYYGLNINTSDFSNGTNLKNFLSRALAGCDKRQDYLLRIHCNNDSIAADVISSLSSNKELWKETISGLAKNGVQYELSSAAFDYDGNNLLLFITKICVDNICNGYTFGNPQTQVSVREWSNRTSTDITSSCGLTWSGSSNQGSLTVKKDGTSIGTYSYTVVTPQIEKGSTYNYTGSGICPKVTVKVGNQTLKQGQDYQVQYSSHINVGTAKVRVAGMGSYSGYVDTSFRIQPCSLTNLTAWVNTSQYAYDGKAKTPKVTVKNAGNALVEGLDYSLTYKNNTKLGTAFVTVKGKGNYQGSKTLKFYIVPKKVTNVKLKAGSGKTLTFSFGKITGASGYELVLYQGSKKVTTVTTTKTSYQFKKLKENSSYTVKVRAYINAGGKKYGAYSSNLNVKTATKAPAWTKVSAEKGKAVLKWKKTTGASGYEVYMSTKEKSGYKKVAALSGSAKVNYTKKSLTSGKTYYFKVRSYTKKGNYKSYSSYSSVKKVKVK